MLEPTRFDGRALRSQLENYKLIIHVNQEIFDKNVDARDKLAAKFTATQVLLDKLEQAGSKVDYIIMLDDANQIVNEICDDVKLILSQDIP